MTVNELIKILQTLPQEKPAAIFWDGQPRGDVEGIVNDDAKVVIVGDWSIYRSPGEYQRYPEEKIVYG